MISSKSKLDKSDLFHDKCEFCEKNFDTKKNLRLKKRYHIYSHHFHKEINNDIDWKPSETVCPAKNCTFSATARVNLINHYIGATHGILDKYIDAKRKGINQKKSTAAEDTTTTEVKSNGSQDVTDHDLSFTPEVSQNLKKGGKFCEAVLFASRLKC